MISRYRSQKQGWGVRVDGMGAQAQELGQRQSRQAEFEETAPTPTIHAATRLLTELTSSIGESVSVGKIT